jgi:hypothetical protein
MGKRVLARALTTYRCQKAGVMEEGPLSYPEAGSPQGGVVSPALANVFMHHVLNQWFVSEVKLRLRGHVFLVRVTGRTFKIICRPVIIA